MKEYKGWLSSVVLEEDEVIVNLKGKKEVRFPYDDLIKVSNNPPTLAQNGYIVMETKSGSCAVVYTKKMRAKFDELFDIFNNIISQITEMSKDSDQFIEVVTTETIFHGSVADELLKFKQLYDAGVISLEEFEKQKKQLLG